MRRRRLLFSSGELTWSVLNIPFNTSLAISFWFLQSSVCLKQLSFDLLERLLLALFPELDHVIRQIHEDQDPLAVPQTNR